MLRSRVLIGNPFVAEKRQRRRRHRSLRCEHLESRQLLAVVTSLANSGPGTLRDAIAGTDPTITFAVSGTINTLTQMIINRSVVIDGSGQNITINNTAAGQRVFSIVAGTSTLKNLTITGGNILSSSPNQTGGAVRVGAATVTIENCVLSNSSAINGGGLAVAGIGANVNLLNSIVRNNSAGNIGGGVSVDTGAVLTVNGSTIENNTVGLDSTAQFLRVGGGVANFANTTIRNSVIRNNRAETPMAPDQLGFGGGIGTLEGSGPTVVENSEISGNISDRGGGIGTRGANVTVKGSLISGNSSPNNGGGIRSMRIGSAAGVITVEDSVFRNNTADGGGGIGSGVYLNSETNTVTLTITRSTFDGNDSLFDGGGVETFGANTTITNSTFVANSADNEGGAIWNSFNETFTGESNWNYTTITGNTSTANGGGLFSGDGTNHLANSILSGNTAASGYGSDLYDPNYLMPMPLDVKFTLVTDISGHLLSTGVMGNIVGATPNLGPLANNGGVTPTRMLMAGPGVNGADPASTMGVDQRGFLRPGANSMRDMGAVESDGSSPTLNLDFNNDGNYDCADMNLLETAIDAGSPIATFDVNQDGMLTSADVFAWLMKAGELRFGTGRFFKSGDANLDGSVDGSDFGVWNANKFTNANRFCQGDFNQDNSVDGSDFGAWNANKFTSSDAGRGSNLGDESAVDVRRRGVTTKGRGVKAPIEAAAVVEGSTNAVPQLNFAKLVSTPDVARTVKTSMGQFDLITPVVRGNDPASAAVRGSFALQDSPLKSAVHERQAKDAVFGELSMW